MRKTQIHKQWAITSILFSGLGIFSYYLLINMGQFPNTSIEHLSSVMAYIFIIVVFNILGFTIIRLSHWVDSITLPYARRKTRLSFVYSLAALILLLINYAILVIAKILIGADEPFVFLNSGYRILIAVWLIELVVVSLLIANRSARTLIELQNEAARLQKENDYAKYDALQNQLNPHFLFNSLNTLISEIEYSPKNAILFTQKLSNVYRYVLQRQRQRIVPLENEIEFLEAYIYLHRVRMGDCLSFINKVDKSEDEIKIAPLSLQLLAENVIKHNVINEENPMDIILDISLEKDYLLFSNIYRPKPSDSKMGIGLKNLSNRYQLLCGKNIEIINDSKNEYFTIKMPIIYE